MYPQIKIDPNFPLSTYNLLFGIGLIAGFLFYEKQSKLFGFDKKKDLYIKLSIVSAMLLGWLGAAISENIFKYHSVFPTSSFLNGFNYLGGLLTASLIFILLISFRKYNILQTINIVIPSLIIAHAFGRIGCFLGGCCYGIPTESFCGIQFPLESFSSKQYGCNVKVFPTQLFEAVFLFILFFFSIKISFRKRLPVYLFSYGLFRILIEQIRGDERGEILSFPPATCISILFVFIGIFLYLPRKYSDKRNL